MMLTKEAILRAGAEFGEMHPSWRFGQIVANVCWWARGPNVDAIQDADDDEILEQIRGHLKEQAQRPPEPVEPGRADWQDPRIRQDVFQAVTELARLHPDWRFGQLVAQVSEWARGADQRDAYDVEDAEFLAAARLRLDNRAGTVDAFADQQS
jgi:hypothetical protein